MLIKLLTDALGPDSGDICLGGVPISNSKSETICSIHNPLLSSKRLFLMQLSGITSRCFAMTLLMKEIIDAITKSGFLRFSPRYADGIDVIDQAGSDVFRWRTTTIWLLHRSCLLQL